MLWLGLHVPQPWAKTQLTTLEATLGLLPSGMPAQGPGQPRRISCSTSHLNDVVSAILAVDSLDSADVQATKHLRAAVHPQPVPAGKDRQAVGMRDREQGREAEGDRETQTDTYRKTGYGTDSDTQATIQRWRETGDAARETERQGDRDTERDRGSGRDRMGKKRGRDIDGP